MQPLYSVGEFNIIAKPIKFFVFIVLKVNEKNIVIHCIYRKMHTGIYLILRGYYLGCIWNLNKQNKL